ncbi:CD1107 family mobile element protein [Butyrivibrio sp. AE2015]|uniref:CD1107 family mobile element protein n=1 Tax=Butyrivibrio sp. AE2015 TaxID=1280663 RepID=UPI00041720C6|nr:DUF4366 domain-containing protein [Butyrivibrio sp. AE2015]
MKKVVSKAVLLAVTVALSGVISFGSHITAFANVPPEADTEGSSTLPESPTDDADNNGTAKGTGTGDPLTPDGNGTEVDSVDDNGKYFYTFVTDAGNYFYVVVDETREDKNVYVLSTVDEEELLSLCEKEDEADVQGATRETSETEANSSTDLFGTPGGTTPGNGSDTDGDGVTDEWDTDGDGIVDAWDTNGDGKPDSFDTNGDGEPDKTLLGPGVVGYDTNGDGIVDAWDTDGDGIIDAYDSDGDGIPDLFGSEASQTASTPAQVKGVQREEEGGIFTDVVKGIKNNLFVIIVFLAVLGAGFYFKFYKPRYGSIGSGGTMDFEDDPDYQDEDDDSEDWGSDSEDEDYTDEESENVEADSDSDGDESEEKSVNEESEDSASNEGTEDSEGNTAEEGSGDSDEARSIDKKKEEAERIAAELKKELKGQKEASEAELIRKDEKIKTLERKVADYEDKVTRTSGILTGSAVPDEEEDEEDPDSEPIYEERASPEI